MIESDKLIFADETYKLVGLCMKMHSELGCGFLEPVYQEAFEILLQEEKIPYAREKRLPIYFMGRLLQKEYYADFVCYEKIILEFKAVSTLTAAHEAQLMNYLKAANLQVGLLCNFAQPSFTYRRFINPHYIPTSNPLNPLNPLLNSTQPQSAQSAVKTNNGFTGLNGFSSKGSPHG